ncbi:MAG: hypothetical protein KIH67_003550 [Candidatus Moranbacteria bacterium]|nr:hypothetical protein [Candidatus Moranbacteria bacterium]
MKNWIQSFVLWTKEDSLRKSPVVAFLFSLACELLLVLYLFFFFLWTAEIILPGFISLRINLSPYFATLLGFTFGLMYLGQQAHYVFPKNFSFEKPLFILAILWSTGIVGLSLIKFPWWAILSLLIAFFVIIFYFWKTLLEDQV